MAFVSPFDCGAWVSVVLTASYIVDPAGVWDTSGHGLQYSPGKVGTGLSVRSWV